MVEDHRHHQLLLVGQVAVEQPLELPEASEKRPRRRLRRRPLPDREEHGVGRLRQVVDRSVHRLVVGVEQLSKATNFQDPLTATLFADGAGAVLVGRPGSPEPGTGFIDRVVLKHDYAPGTIMMENANVALEDRMVNAAPNPGADALVRRQYLSMGGGPRVLRNAVNAMSETVVELLYESDVLLEAQSFDREREVHRQIGDFTLFMAGFFPEYLKRLKTAGHIHHPDFLVDYVKTGKRSYGIVAQSLAVDSEPTSPVFRSLSENFEWCVTGLGFVRTDLERLQDPSYRRAKDVLLN